VIKLGQALWSRLRPWGFLFLWPAWVILFVEWLSRGSVAGAALWAVQHALLFLLNVGLAGSCLLLFVAATGRARPSFWALAAISLVPAAVSGIKLRLMGQPLLPGDFSLAGEITDVALSWKDILSLSLAVGLPLFCAASVALVHWLTPPAPKQRWQGRAAFATAALLLLAAAYAGYPAGARLLDPVANAGQRGYLLSTLLNVRMSRTAYGKGLDGAALPVLATVTHTGPEVAGPAGPVRPNVIVVLSESLWDPTKLPNVTFSQDPLPFLHGLQQRFPSGYMLTPEFGGSTANVEFEVLTGLSMRFLPMPYGVVAYDKYVTRPVDSLASILRRQGYAATAISPWPNWFFSGRRVYEDFGFSKFISQEFMEQQYSGPYIQDQAVARTIIAESDRSPGPDIIFANTAENHYSYERGGKFAVNRIAVTGLSPDSQAILETYAEGCLRADEMLHTLVAHFEETKEPTVILFFGDHLAVLGKDYAVYKETGYITGPDDPDFLNRMYRTPVVVWDNFLPERHDQLDLSAAFLGPYLLERAGLESTPFLDYLREFSLRHPVVPPVKDWERMGLSKSLFGEYEALENDILVGEAKTYGDLKDRIVDPHFVLGYGQMEIDRAEAGQGEGLGLDTALTVTGRFLPPTGVIWLNGAPLPTTWMDEEHLTARVARQTAPSGPWEVQVRVPDLQKPSAAVAESNSLTIGGK
jgi:phosphoglycerol transferase MdoB-like AlkP superfamily enzyme